MDITNENVLFRPLQMEDLDSVVKLYRSVFGKKLSPDYFRLKYLSGYLIEETFARVAVKDGQIVAFAGAIPHVYGFNGESMLVAQTCEYLTHPSARQQGLSSKLVDLQMMAIQESGIDLVFSYFTEPSYRRIRKYNFKDLRKLSYAIVKTGAIPTHKVRYKLMNSDRWLQFTKGLNEVVWEKQSSERWEERVDQELLKYKQFTNNGIFRFGECNFWIKLSEIAHVGRFDTANYEAFRSGFDLLKKHCKSKGIDKILFHVDPEGDEYEFLSRVEGLELIPAWLVAIKSFSDRDFPNFFWHYSSFDNF